jgi:flagellar motor switch protein FliG
VGKPEAKRQLRNPRRRRVNNIKRDLGEMNWINLAQDRVQRRALINTVMNLQGP